VYEISNVSEEVMRSMTIGKNAGSNVALDVYGNAYITGSLTVTGTITGTVGGVSGTTNYIPKFTSTTAIGNSLIYDNGTNVGIGTTNPVAKFDVGGNIVASGSVLARDTTEAQVQLRYAGGTPNVSYVFNAATAFGFFDSTNARHMSYYDRSGNNWYFYTNGTTKMTIDTNGYVGIGTTSPGEKLEVAGNILSKFSSTDNSGFLQYSGTTHIFSITRQTNNVSLSGYDGVGLAPGATTGPSTSYALYAKSGGNVGIGTTSPNALLSFGTGVVDNKIYLYDASGDKYGFGIRSNQLMIYSGAGGASTGGITFGKYDGTTFTETVRFTNAGNVGIGTTSPSGKLDLEGAGAIYLDLNSTDNGGREIRFQNNGSTQAYIWHSGTYLAMGGGSNNNSVFMSNGLVGINTASPSTTLDVNGEIKAANGLIVGSGTNPVKTYVWNSLAGPSAASAYRYEIARIAIDYNDWNNIGVFEVELFEHYYSGGLKKKYIVYYGYSSNYGVKLVEYQGTDANGSNNFRVTTSGETTVSGDHRYISVYVDVRYYGYVTVRVTTNRLISTSNPPAIGYTYINLSPSGTSISDFTSDSTVQPTISSAMILPGSLGLNGQDPSYKLDIAGASSGNITARLTTNDSKVRFYGYDLLGYNGANLWAISNTSANQFTLGTSWDWDYSCDLLYTPGTAGAVGGTLVIGQTNKNNANYTHGSTIFYTNGAEKARITRYGTLLVGDSVEINGSWYNNGIGIFGKNGTDKMIVGYLASNTNGALIGAHNSALNAWAVTNINGSQIVFRINETEKVRIDASGNVGIGTSSPSYKLDVNVAGTGVGVRAYNGGNYLQMGGIGGGTAYFKGYETIVAYGNIYGGYVTFLVGDAEKVRIDNSGNVGIGTTSPNAKLDVNGNTIITGSLTVTGSIAVTGKLSVTDTLDSTDVFGLKTFTKSLTLTTSWIDTGISGTDLSTGTYIVQVYVHNYDVSGGQYDEYYSGTMSWFASTTNSTDADEIVLHKAGHAPNGNWINLRTLRQANPGTLKLQIISSVATTGADNYIFKFRRMI
jgi:hypothetical protein